MRRSLALAAVATLCWAVGHGTVSVNYLQERPEPNSDVLSLVQAVTLMQMNHRWLRSSMGVSAWLEDPVLRQRLSELLFERGQDPGQMDSSRVEEMWHSSLKEDMDKIMHNELQKRVNLSQVEALQEDSAEQRHRSLEERKHKGEEKARKRRVKSERRKDLYEEGRRRRLEEALRKRQQREEERKLREAAELQHKRVLRDKMVQEEGRLREAKEAARRAEEERVRWEAAEVAAEQKAAEKRKLEYEAHQSEERAKQTAEEQLKLEAAAKAAEERAKRSAEEQLKLEEAAKAEEEKAKEAVEEQLRLEAAARDAEAKAVAEEAKWEALVEEAKEREELVQQEEQKAEEEAKAKAKEDNRRKAEEEDALKTLEDVIKAEEEAQQKARAKTEEEARVKDARTKAEEEASVKAEAEARAEADGEARGKTEEEEVKAKEEARVKAEEEARAEEDASTRSKQEDTGTVTDTATKGEDAGTVAKDMGAYVKADNGHSSGTDASTAVDGEGGTEAVPSGSSAEELASTNEAEEDAGTKAEEDARDGAKEGISIKAEEEASIKEEDAGTKAELASGAGAELDSSTKGEDAGIKALDIGSKTKGSKVDIASTQVDNTAGIEAKADAGTEAGSGTNAKNYAGSEVSSKTDGKVRIKAEDAGATTEESAVTTEDQPEVKQEGEDAATTNAQEAKDARVKAEEEARVKAEHEFQKLKSEMEAKLRAEAEARLKAEQEAARLKAELDSRLKSELDAKLKAEEAARVKAEEEARRQAAEEARLKAEEDAERAAEAEVKRKAEEAAEAKVADDARQVEEDAKLKDPNTEIKGEDSKLLHNVVKGGNLDLTKVENGFDGRFDDAAEVQQILGAFDEQGHVCVKPEELASSLRQSKQAVLQGLPEWTQRDVPSEVADVIIAFLIQASWEEQLPVLRRTFDRLYLAKDLYLYTVDRERMDMQKVIETLPNPLPQNVVVQPSAHSEYFVWPRVEIVLSGLRTLLSHAYRWDFVIHLSESDYPVHNLNWIRKSLALQRNTNFIQIIPRCQRQGDSGLDFRRDDWYWWTQTDAMASCGSEIEVKQVEGVTFPMDKLENRGFRFAHGAEWMVVTRELVKYALSPQLFHYRKLVGMHVGADEIFWQSLILNIPNFKQTVSQQGWFIRWGHGKTDHSPDTLNEKYEQELLQHRNEFFFMRKVSPADSGKLMDRIDALVQQPDSVPGPVTQKPGEDWSLNTVACPESLQFVEREFDEPLQDLPAPPPPSKSKHWQGTKSRKQLVEAYKWYMQNQ